jgi:catecholate siderophore receptor
MPQFERRPLAATIALLFSAPAWVAAQSAPEVVAQSTTPSTLPTLPEVKAKAAPDEPNFRTDVIRSSTRTDTPLRDVPQFINIVPQSLIRSQNALTLQDALRNVPGISYGAAEGGSQASQQVFLRGFPLNADTFLDGVRDLGEYNRDLFATESVEVLKGSSGLLFGRGSTGGLINQVSKVADRQERKEVALSVGSFDLKRATVDLNLRTGENSAFRVVGLGEKSGSYRYPQDVDKIGFAPSFWVNVNGTTDITLSYYYLKTNDVTDYGQPTMFNAATGFFGFAPVSPRTYYGYANYDYAEHDTNIATFTIDHRFNAALSLRNTLRYAQYARNLEATIAQGVNATDANGAPITRNTPPSLLTVTRNHDTNRSRDNDDSSLINQTDLIWKTVTGSVSHTVLSGLELSEEKLDRRNYKLDASPAPGVQAPTSIAPLLAPDPYTLLSYTKTPNLNALAKGETVAVYVQDQLDLTPQWKALIGVRYEHYKSTAETVALSPNPTAAPVGPFSSTDSYWSGRAGVIWQPTNQQSYYVSYGNSYNPSGELGVYGGTAQTNLNAINANLDPEKSQNYEIGGQWDLRNGLQLRSAIFRNEKTNARFVDPATGQTVLAGKRRVDGIEFEASGSITPNWDVYSAIAFMNGEIINGIPANIGHTPLGVAKVAGNLWTVYRFLPGWEIGGGLRGQDGTWLTDGNQPGSQIPSYIVFDATAAYVQRQYEVRVNVYNIGDKTYYYGGYENNPNRVLPAMPRAASLTVRYNFD